MREFLVIKNTGKPVSNTNIYVLLNSWKMTSEDEEQSPKSPGFLSMQKRTG